MKKHLREMGYACRAILWSFFGVRKQTSHQRDEAKIKPVYLVVIALLLAAVLVWILVMLARMAVKVTA